MSKCAVFLSLLVALSAWADDDSQHTPFGARPGYVSNVVEEKNKRDIEMVMLEKPKAPPKPIKEVIFNDKLSKEFQQQYEYRFGQTQAEQAINSPSQHDGYIYYTGQNVTLHEYRKEQRKFAEYMGRRLTEFHVDKWAKSDPDFRPVYEMKDKLSNLNVKLNKGYRVKWKYNFSGPSMDVSVDNPHDIDLKVRTEMSGVVSSPDEVIYTVGYPVTEKVRVSALYRERDGIYQLVGTRRINTHLSTSISGSKDTLSAGPTVQQDLILVGFTWTE